MTLIYCSSVNELILEINNDILLNTLYTGKQYGVNGLRTFYYKICFMTGDDQKKKKRKIILIKFIITNNVVPM